MYSSTDVRDLLESLKQEMQPCIQKVAYLKHPVQRSTMLNPPVNVCMCLYVILALTTTVLHALRAYI